MNTLRHLAIIMDGNGRWATNRNLPRGRGHHKGADVVFDIIRHSARIGIPTLSLFAFSKDNWHRPVAEVNLLMKIISKSLRENLATFREHGIRLRVIGDFDELSQSIREDIITTELATARLNGMELIIAFNYSGQFDILQAVRRLSKENISLSDISYQDLQNALLTGTAENPDLIIRTGGETRLSNFYLWQSACSEIHFEEKLWPNFTCDDLDRHVACYMNTERRFGRTSAQLKKV
jgi:undecaprenyl diphosphate synthase